VKERGRGKGEEEKKKWRIFLYHDVQG